MSDVGATGSPLTSTDAVGLSRSMRAGEIRAVDVTQTFLERIERLDGRLNAFIRINPAAEHEAAEADRRIEEGRAGPLTGVPVAIKDNIATEALQTTCGSRLLREFVPARDATAVARLRSAGAVVLGKTNLDEFGMGSSSENSAYGPTVNPWDTDRVPGGSSGGSAVAVAAGMAPVALGSDTGGSVRQPAAFCGVVGLKPTYGRVSRSGLVAFGSSLDQIGLMARSMPDAALLLEGVAGMDADDSTTSDRPTGDLVSECGRGVDGLTVGVPREYFGEGLDVEIERAVRRGAERLEREGARVREITLPHTRYAIPTYYLVATAEASSNLARFDGVRYGRREDPGSGLQAMYRASRGRGLGDEVQRRIMLGTFALSAGYHERFYGKAMRARTLLRRDFVRAFDGGVDVILTPATPTTAFRLGEKTGDPLRMYLSDVYTVTANLAGLPALVVPVGRNAEGLPMGAQLIGRDFEEGTLLRVGAVLDQRSAIGIPPEPESPSRDESDSDGLE